MREAARPVEGNVMVEVTHNNQHLFIIRRHEIWRNEKAFQENGNRVFDSMPRCSSIKENRAPIGMWPALSVLPRGNVMTAVFYRNRRSHCHRKASSSCAKRNRRNIMLSNARCQCAHFRGVTRATLACARGKRRAVWYVPYVRR